MASSSKTTKDHDEIRSWAEERGGKPAHVAGTDSKEDIGILRIEFPGAPASNDSKLEEISWDQFFEKFDERGLALLYQEETAAGERSNFNKLVSSESADEAEESHPSGSGKSASGRSARSRKSTAKKSATSRGGVKTAASSGSRPEAKRTSSAKKAAPAKKAALASKSAAGRKAAPAKKSAAPAKKSGPARKASTANRSAGGRGPAKKATAKKAVTPAKKAATGKNTSARSSSTKRAGAKKAAEGRRRR